MQAKASKLLLDTAERTKWKWGPFKELNRIRAEQRHDLQTFYATHPIPHDVDLRLESLALIIPISTDKLICLKEIIVDALQQSQEDLEEFERSYRSIVERSSSGCSMHLGRIQRPGGTWPGRVTFSESLPDSVRFIDLEIRKTFSSLALLYVTADIDEELTSDIAKIVGTPKLPIFRITGLSIRRPWIAGWRSKGVDLRCEAAKRLNVVVRDIVDFLQLKRLHQPSEASLSERIGPIVAYSIKAGPSDSDHIKEWVEKNHLWLTGLGVETFPFLLFSNGKSVFTWSSTSRSADDPLPHHILTFRNLCGREWYRELRNTVHTVAPAAAILDWSESSTLDMEKLRDAAFALVNSEE